MQLNIKKSIIIICSLFYLCSCSEKSKLNKELKEYFTQKALDSTETLDSFKFIRLDTLYELDRIADLSIYYANSIIPFVEKYKSLDAEVLENLSKMKTLIAIDAPDLADIEKQRGKANQTKMKEIREVIDTILNLDKQIQIEAKSADTTKAIGYSAICKYQIKRKDNSVERDTAVIYLNENKNIISKNDYLKLPYIIDFNKL